MALILNSGILWRHYYVIIGNMEGFITLLSVKVEGQNFTDWGIFAVYFYKKLPIFRIQSFYTSL